MDFKNPNLTKIIDFEKLEKQAAKSEAAGIDKFAMAKMMAMPILKSLPANAKYLIAVALISLVTGFFTILYGVGVFVHFLVSLFF